MLYSGNHKLPPVDKETFIKLLRISTCNVLMLTHEGYYRQVDGLAMGSPPAPLLANGWLSKRDTAIRADAKLYSRYMDDVIRSIKSCEIEQKLNEINKLHPSLKFTIERETNESIPFLDMLIMRENGKLTSTWYNKPTDTGLIMNYHSLAPKKYKRSVVAGLVHRIYRACSTWIHFHNSLIRAKRILEGNQYPPQFYEPILEQTIDKILCKDKEKELVGNEQESQNEAIQKKMIFIQYRGKITEDYCRALRKCNAPCDPIMTLRKLKSVLPPLKAATEKQIRSDIVYKIICPRCKACYIGQTTQYLIDRFKQHLRLSQPVGKHFQECLCRGQVRVEDIEILASTTRSVQYLETLEALWQEELRPTINTKDEFRSRELTIKL